MLCTTTDKRYLHIKPMDARYKLKLSNMPFSCSWIELNLASSRNFSSENDITFPSSLDSIVSTFKSNPNNTKMAAIWNKSPLWTRSSGSSTGEVCDEPRRCPRRRLGINGVHIFSQLYLMFIPVDHCNRYRRQRWCQWQKTWLQETRD